MSQIFLQGCIEGGDSILTSAKQETSRDQNSEVEIHSILYKDFYLLIIFFFFLKRRRKKERVKAYKFKHLILNSEWMTILQNLTI